MLLAITLATMTIVVVATVVLPLLKGARPAPARAEFDRAVYRDQLRELERDRARGLIDAAEAATARLEIERRLLGTASASGEPASAVPGSPFLAVFLALALPAAAAILYLLTGAPGVPDQPLAERAAERSLAAANGHTDMAKTVAALEERLKTNPENGQDWLLLARSDAAMGQWQKSADAYRQAMRLGQNRPDIAAAYGEMLVLAAEGIVTPRAQQIFSAALARDPGNAASRYYLALARAQAGESAAAIAEWQKLAAEEPADSPLRAQIKSRIAEAAGRAGMTAPPLPPPAAGPSEAQMAGAATLSPAEREQMIRGMVAKLADGLKSRPDDLAGWMRLGRAYAVLGEGEKAADAYEQAAKLKPDDPQILLAAADALLPDRKPETPVPPRVVALLKRVDALDQKQPAALWYLGLAAAQQRHFAEAGGYWQRLLPLLPPESEQHKAVAAAIEALAKK